MCVRVCLSVTTKSAAYLVSSVLLQVPLGIMLKNENSHEDMVAIMDHAHQYVPTQTSEIIHVDESGDSVTIKEDKFHNILFGELIRVYMYYVPAYGDQGGPLSLTLG